MTARSARLPGRSATTNARRAWPTGIPLRCCGGATANVTSWTGCWRPCGRGGAARWSCGGGRDRQDRAAGVRDRGLLGSVVRGPLDERVQDRIVAETRGNPLALLKLLRGLSPAQLAGGFWLPSELPLSDRIEERFQRIEALPAESRRLLLLAAPEPVGDLALFRRAAERSAQRRRARARGGRRAPRVRRAGPLPPPAGALRRLPCGAARGASERASGAGRGDGSRARSGSPRLAPRAGGRGPRRGRRR